MSLAQQFRRADSWAARGEDFAKIRALGCTVRILSHEARHVRVTIRGHGWFDYWPSTERWAESTRPGGVRGRRGRGLAGLLAALTEAKAALAAEAGR